MTAPATLEEVLRVLREKQPEARNLGIELVGVVGSFARREARPNSDVDVVFDPGPGFDYWRLGALISELSGILGRPVDLVDRQMMRPERWAWMARDLAPLE
jgi:predicted nucleotidyltransferase